MRYGSTKLPPRFWAKVEFGPDGFHSQTGKNLGPCWIWIGGLNPDGYGHWTIGSRTDGTRTGLGTHCSAWMAANGPIAKPLELDHLCRVRACCNPLHLELVTHAENSNRCDRRVMSEKARARHRVRRVAITQCPKGHAYSEHGIVHSPEYPESRRCRLCRIEYLRAYRRRV